MSSTAKVSATGMRSTGARDYDAVAARLRAMAIDNFSLVGNVVRIGSAEWRLSACACGFSGCDGWALEPINDITGEA